MKTITLFKTVLFVSAICFSSVIYAQNNTNNDNNPPTTATNNNNNNTNNDNNPPTTASNNNNNNKNNSNHNNNNNPPVTASNKWEGDSKVETGLVKVYPNPSQGKFEISFTTQEASEVVIRLVDIAGQVVFGDALSGYTGSYSNNVDLGAHVAGVYFLAININGNITRERILYIN